MLPTRQLLNDFLLTLKLRHYREQCSRVVLHRNVNSATAFYYLYSMRYLLFLGFMLLLRLNCFAQNMVSLGGDQRYNDSVNNEYRKRRVVFDDSVNKEWNNKVSMIKKSPYFSVQQKKDFTSKEAEQAFLKACWGCGNNCCGEYISPPCPSRPRYINNYQQQAKPIEVPVYKLKDSN